jgi:RHS repeat-associated protein
MVLTDEFRSDPYEPLSFEDQNINQQNALWENKQGTSINVASVRTSITMNTGQTQAMLVRKTTGSIGATKLLKVMAGDRIHTKVDYYYTTTAAAFNPASNNLGGLVNSIVGALTNSVAPTDIVHGSETTISTQLNSNTDLNTIVNTAGSTNPANTSQQAPKAYLCVLFFNEQFQFDKNSSVVVPVGYYPNQRQTIDKFLSNAVPVKKNGYAYIYFTNESDELVYFDNFNLTHERGAILEETHYYPYGLTMAGISSKALGFGSYENKMKFQGQKFDNKEFSDGSGLEMYEFKWRMHDPQTGRFWQIDPLSDTYVYNSTYAFSENKVTSHVELEGLEAKLAIAGKGTNISYSREDVNAFDSRAKNLERKAGFTPSQVHNGDQIVNELVRGTANEGSVGAVVIFAHASQEGVYLDNNDGLYRDNEWHGGSKSANVQEIKRGVEEGDIKFDKNAVIVMGGCNCGRDDGTPSLAESMAQELGVTVYAATGSVYPENANGKETGKLQTDGTFYMYKMTPETTVEVPGYGTLTIPASVGTTNIGKSIDPSKLVYPQAK